MSSIGEAKDAIAALDGSVSVLNIPQSNSL